MSGVGRVCVPEWVGFGEMFLFVGLFVFVSAVFVVGVYAYVDVRVDVRRRKGV